MSAAADGSRHLEDLVAEANRRTQDLISLPIGHLVKSATDSTSHANSFAEYHRRDQAFIEFLVAMNIATNVIPRHRDFVSIRQKQSLLAKQYWQTLDNLKRMEDQFDKIKASIKMDNMRTGVQPKQGSLPDGRRSRPISQQSVRSTSRPDEMFLDSPSLAPAPSTGPRPSSSDFSDLTASLDSNSTTSLSRSRPQVRPKPDNLHGRTLPPSLAAGQPVSNGVPNLVERFALLRPTTMTQAPAPPRHDSMYQQSFGMGPTPNTSMASQKPPTAVRNGPSIPPKLPLDTGLAISMPKPPSPTYSPARNMQTPAGVNPPRTTARSAVRSNSIVSMAPSSASTRPPGDSENGSYFPSTNGTSQNGRSKRKGSIGLPSEGRGIEPKILLDYMNLYKILIIDVRDRREYDQGHIDSMATICVSPESLRQDMTDEDLERAMLLAPDNEMSHFSKRDQVDLVVYYDQSTQTPAFLTKATRTPQEDSLRYVFDALWELHISKTLRRPPLLLIGGLDAWSDLLGYAALRTSDTLSMTGIKAKAPSRRPIPAPSSAAMLAMEKRRRREYNPLDAEEERRWQESARKESVYIATEEEEEGGEGEEDDDAQASFYRSQEDFYRRFPALPVEQESMVQASPRNEVQYPVQPLPSRPAPINSYAANAVHEPAFPSRPAPAAPRVSYSGAHDRNEMQNGNTAISRSQQLRPYVPPREMPHNIRLPRTGLVNFGVTCYMNSTIQCLNATIPLSTQFRNDNYGSYLQRDNWKGARGLFPQHFANLVKHLWVGDVQAVRPSTFRNFCARLDSKYGIEQQQDAKEFLEFTLDYLHEDLNISWKNDPPHVLSKAEEDIRERLPKGYAAMIEWSRFTKRSKSLIQDLFAGQHYSKIKCLKCGHTSTTYETFFSISVEIPRSGHGNIYDCLASYCKEEILEDDERPKCEKCNKQRDHTKQITITRAPRFLVVHFKRFTAKLSKIHTPVAFPLQQLDITKFVLPPLTLHEREQVARETADPGFIKRGQDDCMQPPYLYNTYAITRHHGGTLGGGHYTSLCRDPGRNCWRLFNDSRVDDVEVDQKKAMTEAYVVFFERIPPPGSGVL